MTKLFVTRALNVLNSYSDSSACERRSTSPKYISKFDRLLAGNRTRAERRNPSIVIPITKFLGDIKFESAVDGQIAVLSGERAGWSDILLAWRCLAWRSRVWAYETDRIGGTNWWPQEYATVLLVAIVLRQNRFVAWCLEWVRDFISRNNADPTVLRSWDIPVYWLALKLAYISAGRQWDLNNVKIGAFSDAMEVSADSPAFAECVNILCKSHAHEVSHMAQYLPAVVHDPLLWYFPAEVLAILAVRKRSELLNSDNLHPLLMTSLAIVPQSIPRIENSILDRAIIFFREQIPALAEFDP